MDFISTKGMKNENAPSSKVLVQYLEPSFGYYSIEFEIGYFDNPLDYDGKPESECGWKLWHNSRQIKVLAYAQLPEKIESRFDSISQTDFKSEFGSTNPNLGCIGE